MIPNRTQQNVTLVELNKDDDVPTDGRTLTYFGWGVTSQNSTNPPVSDVPLEIEAAVISNEECSNIHGIYMGMNQSYNGYITENMICTLATDKDSCQRDSGGPEIMKGSDATTDVQVGVISWGLGCATNIFPGVSARISTAYGWIRKEVCDRSSEPPLDFECQLHDASNITDSPTTSPVVIPYSSILDTMPARSSPPSLNESVVTTDTIADVPSSSAMTALAQSKVTLAILLLLRW